jgi:hypothetical protein
MQPCCCSLTTIWLSWDQTRLIVPIRAKDRQLVAPKLCGGGGHSNGRKIINEMVSNTSHTWFPCVRYQSIHSILAIIMRRAPLISLQWWKAREAHLEVWCSSVWIGIWALLWEPNSPCTVMWVEGRRKLGVALTPEFQHLSTPSLQTHFLSVAVKKISHSPFTIPCSPRAI